MAACTRIVLACSLAVALSPAAQAQTRQSSGAWTTLCSGGATGYCSASNRIKAVGGAPYRFQLNVSRGAPGAGFEIALLAPREHPGEDATISVEVDRRNPLTLAPGEGYRRAGRSHTYLVAARETGDLLERMRRGQRVVFRYQDAKGDTVTAAFSLTGLSNALAFMDRMQPAPRAAAGKKTALPATPAPVEDAESLPPRSIASGPSAPLAAPTATTPESVAAGSASPRVARPAEDTSRARAPAQAIAERPGPTQPAAATPAPALAAAQPATTAHAPTAAVTQPAATPPAASAPTLSAGPTPAPPAAPAQPVAATPAAPPASAQSAAAPPASAAASTQSVAAAAPTTAPAQTPASLGSAAERAPAPARKPSTAQKQAAISPAPSASRKRGARSIRQFSCRGNEPFWTFVIDNDKARYSTPADAGRADAVEIKGKLNVTGDGPTPIVDWRGRSDWGGSFRAVVSEQVCHDSMSDSEGQTEFEYRARVTLPGGKTVEGCCNAGLPPMAAATEVTQYPVADVRARPETDWSHHLFDLLPAIQACIDKTPEPYPYATKAWPMNRGMVGVRTRNRGGGWFECVAESNGHSVDRFISLPSTAPRAPNEDRVVFSPPDQSPPEGNCFRHERVMDGIGDFMGWLSTDGCS